MNKAAEKSAALPFRNQKACGGRLSHVRGVCSAQPFHEPESPDRNERENEKTSAGKKRRHCAAIHGILRALAGLWSRLTGRPPGLPRSLVDQIEHSFSKICRDQIVRATPSTDVNLCSRGAYQIAVAVERIQQTRLVGAGIRLNSPQCALVDEECSFQRTVVPPEPYGSPGLVI